MPGTAAQSQTPLLWVLAAVVMAVLIGALLVRASARKGTADTGANAGAAHPPADARHAHDHAHDHDHGRVVWAGSPASFRVTPESAVLATSADAARVVESAWDRLAYSSEAAQGVLRDAWGVRSRQGLLLKMAWLVRMGHRARYSREVAEWSAMGAVKARRFRASLRAQAQADGRAPGNEAREKLWRFDAVRANASDVRDVNFVAWDVQRLANLARAGAGAGYLRDEEAAAGLEFGAHVIRREYDSWRSLAWHMAVARWYWDSGGDAGILRCGQLRADMLLAPPDGPWACVPFEAELPPLTPRFAQLLRAEGVLPMLTACDFVDDVTRLVQEQAS